MKYLLAIFIVFIFVPSNAKEGNYEIITISYDGLHYVPKEKKTPPANTYSCVGINLSQQYGYWLIIAGPWREKNCINFSKKIRAEIFKFYKNKGTSLIIEPKCAHDTNLLSCGWKKVNKVD